MKRLLAALLLCSINLYATIEVGDTVPNLCWKDSNDRPLCLEDAKNNVRVMVYGSGWCPDCNTEIVKLVARVHEFDGKGVVFYSLMAEGFNHKDPADTQFLKAWAAKHHIDFAVAASPHDPGKQFFEAPHYIPNFVIVDRNGKLYYKSNEVETDEMLLKLKQLLP